MNIAILEDEQIYINNLEKIIKEYFNKNDKKYNLYTFKNYEEFVEKNIIYDIIFLDIELPNIDGITIARNLREQNIQSEIIFITSHEEYVFTGYEVSALNFLIKPINYEKFELCMKIYDKKHKTNLFSYSKNYESYYINYNEIYYFESSNHTIKIFAKEIRDSFREKFIDLENRLPKEFIKCHRAYIVNVKNINKINADTLSLVDGSVLPISRNLLKETKKRISEIIITL